MRRVSGRPRQGRRRSVRHAGGDLRLPHPVVEHLGALPHGGTAHPETGRKIVDRELAKHTIDTLTLLAEKTRGNLDPNEHELLTRILYELKMRFVKLG